MASDRKVTSEQERVDPGLLEERNRILEESTRIGLWQVDRAGRTLFLNPAMRSMLELEDDDDLKSVTYHEFFCTQSRERMEKEQDRRLSGAASNYEARLIGRKGTQRHVIVCGAAVAGGAAKLGSTLGMFIDITGLKTIEAALRSNEQFLSQVMDSAIDAILVFGEDEKKILYCNPAVEEIFGLPAYELHGSHVSRLFVDSSWIALRAEMARLMAMASPERIGDIIEVAGRRHDGGEVPLEISISETMLDDHPTYITFVRDITERKESEMALLEEKEKYRSFFMEDLTGDFVSTVDNRLLECNPAFARIFGFDSVQEALKCDVTSLYPDPDDRAAFLERLAREKMLVNEEAELRRRDGSPVHLVENVAGIFDENGYLAGVKGYIFDITEHKRVEEEYRQSQKMEAVGRLAGGVAHDFNNILTAILGYTDLLSSSVRGDARMSRHLEEIRKAAGRAGALTRQLLAFSRRQVLKPRILNLNEVIQDMEEMLRRLIPENINLEITLAPDLIPVKADLIQLQQVILNLAVNAKDAMPGGGRIGIRTGNASLLDPEQIRPMQIGPGRYAVVTVTDSGIGMDDGTMSMAFEPFFTTKEKGKGTGLGLSTVYGIVKQSGGDIRITSEPESGAVFEIFLPGLVVMAQESEGTGSSAETLRGDETILLVEDEEPVRAMVREILEMHGHTVLEAAAGGDALRSVEEYDGDIHLLLTDVVMPDMSGAELNSSLSAGYPDLRVLYMSGYAGEEIATIGLSVQSEDFIQKPFRAVDLMRQVRRVLDGALN